MVGNVWEWVADWSDAADGCTTWNSSYGGDSSCFGGPGSATSNLPGALLRGGNWAHGTGAGVFAVVAFYGPTLVDDGVGFRCAR